MRPTTLAVLALFLLAAGCARLSDNRTADLKAGEVFDSIEIPEQKSPLKLEVKVEATGPVNGCLFPGAKYDAVMAALLSKKQPADALAYATDQAAFTLSGTLPANEVGRLWIKNVGTGSVTVKVKLVGY